MSPRELFYRARSQICFFTIVRNNFLHEYFVVLNNLWSLVLQFTGRVEVSTNESVDLTYSHYSLRIVSAGFFMDHKLLKTEYCLLQWLKN